MNKTYNRLNIREKVLNKADTPIHNNDFFFELAKKDIEKSHNIKAVKGIEAYFSNRYGWALRKTKD